jgi:hypothetical protein
MTIKESAQEIEAFLNSDFDSTNDAPNMKEFITALKLVLSYMKCMVSDNPLTTEQLKEMRGNPVLVVWKDNRILPRWYIVGGRSWNLNEFDTFKDYGDWLAYAYQPAHIDREEWKPCWTCRSVKSEPSWGKKYKYCPHCGRPLTPDAWDALEKRIR